MVEFVLISAPLFLLSITMLAIGSSAFTLSVMRDSAIEGARFAALADQDSASGCLRAEEIAKSAIGKMVSITATCELIRDEYEMVEIKGKIPLLGFLAGAREFVVTSMAPREN